MQQKNWDYHAERCTGEWKRMGFKNFRLSIVARVLFLLLTLTTLAWCIVNHLYLRSVYLGAAAILLAMELIWYLERYNRDVRNFMNSILQKDFTTHYTATGQGKSPDELYQIFNRVSALFRHISAEKEIQHRYLEMLVEHLRVGIISMDASGKIHLVNQALKDLLQKNVITHIDALDHSLTQLISEIHSGETRLLKMKAGNELLQLSVHAAEFKLDEKYYKLLSLQNIRNELDVREMEAWQKLIRVLSHEIMNSVAPIISLSGTLHGLVKQSEVYTTENTLLTNLDHGLDAIKIRSEGLYNFTQTYRQLTGVPQVSIKTTNLKEIVDRVELLMQARLREKNVRLLPEHTDEVIHVDPELMEHVLINLVINAIEAADKTDAFIRVHASRNTKGDVFIYVADNGTGMDEGTMEKIFIPFFTTKKNGSGIGLALTKQILQLHHADITLTSEPGNGTTFIITL